MKRYLLYSIILLLLSLIASCSVVMIDNMGTRYSNIINNDTSREQIHKVFGNPVSENLFDTPLDKRDIPELRYLYVKVKNCKVDDYVKVEDRHVVASEVFKISGYVRRGEEAEAAGFILLYDIYTLGLFEVISFPIAIYSYVMESMTEKKVTIWYSENMTCVVGNIVDLKTNEQLRSLP